MAVFAGPASRAPTLAIRARWVAAAAGFTPKTSSYCRVGVVMMLTVLAARYPPV